MPPLSFPSGLSANDLIASPISVQPYFAVPIGNTASTNFNTNGLSISTAGGGAFTRPAPDGLSAATSVPRLDLTSIAGLNNFVSFHDNNLQFLRAFGLYLSVICNLSVTKADMKFFSGFAPLNTGVLFAAPEPSTFLNTLNISKDSTDTNLFLRANDGAGLGSSVDLGIAPAALQGVYTRFNLFVMPSENILNCNIVNMETNAVLASATLSSQLPAATTLMVCPMLMAGTGPTTAAAVALQIMAIQLLVGPPTGFQLTS